MNGGERGREKMSTDWMFLTWCRMTWGASHDVSLELFMSKTRVLRESAPFERRGRYMTERTMTQEEKERKHMPSLLFTTVCVHYLCTSRVLREDWCYTTEGQLLLLFLLFVVWEGKTFLAFSRNDTEHSKGIIMMMIIIIECTTFLYIWEREGVDFENIPLLVSISLKNEKTISEGFREKELLNRERSVRYQVNSAWVSSLSLEIFNETEK